MTAVSFDGAKKCIDLHVLLTLQPRCESRADRDGRLEDVDRASGPVEENETARTHVERFDWRWSPSYQWHRCGASPAGRWSTECYNPL